MIRLLETVKLSVETIRDQVVKKGFPEEFFTTNDLRLQNKQTN